MIALPINQLLITNISFPLMAVNSSPPAPIIFMKPRIKPKMLIKKIRAEINIKKSKTKVNSPVLSMVGLLAGGVMSGFSTN